LADLCLEASLNLLHNCANHAAHFIQNFAFQMPPKGEPHLEQFEIWFGAAKDLRIGDELGDAVTVERVFFNDGYGLFRKQFAELAQPAWHIQLTWAE